MPYSHSYESPERHLLAACNDCTKSWSGSEARKNAIAHVHASGHSITTTSSKTTIVNPIPGF